MERKLGPNMKRLLAHVVAANATRGKGMTGAIEALTTPGRMVQLSRDALAWCDAAITVFKSAPDNPYGDDDEAIAGRILLEIDDRPV